MIKLGDVVSVLRDYPDNTFDGVLCDPPYGLSFMGKRWDYDVPSSDLWAEVLRVCKPGAPLLAAFGSRTYHRGVVRIEDAGWEIRDSVVWMYGSGFPKSLDVSKAIDAKAGAERKVVGQAHRKATGRMAQGEGGYAFAEDYALTAPATPLAATWSGYGTALKPAHEPYVLARKPLDGTVAENVTRWGVGALAIDACRIGSPWFTTADATNLGGDDTKGRWPANVILDEEAGAALDGQTGITSSSDRPRFNSGTDSVARGKHKPHVGGGYADSGGASRFFYCAKASRAERDAGCGDLPAREVDGAHGYRTLPDQRMEREQDRRPMRNHHPTVKPLALCEYLARLILPPRPGVLLVPFAGSGSEVIGALRAGWPEVVGIEREAEYVEIARRRVEHALATPPAKPKPAPKPRARKQPKPLVVVVRRLEQIPLFT